MDLCRGSEAEEGDQPGGLWKLAGHIASEWLNVAGSSLDANILMYYAMRLLQAAIYELELSKEAPETILYACRSFLSKEWVTPGAVIDRLLSSESPEVVSVARKVQICGEGWVLAEAPQGNLIIMTALMNLPASPAV